jgi:hypothetical protein
MENLKTTLFLLEGEKKKYYSESQYFGDNFCEELENELIQIKKVGSSYQNDLNKIDSFKKILKEVEIKTKVFIYDNSHVEDLFLSSCVLDKSFYDNLKPNDQFSPMCFTPLNETGIMFLDFLSEYQISFRLIRIYWKSKTENVLYLSPFHNDFADDNIF